VNAVWQGALSALVLVLALGGLAGAQTAQQAGSEMEGLAVSVTGPLEDPILEARATKLSAELRCPVCQGLSIHDSPSPLAQQMKDLIRSQVASGWSDAEVTEYFVSKYGEWVLLSPKASGFNLLVYVLPGLMLVGGGAFIFMAVRRWTGPAPEQVIQEP
jgi:cytochrome c-type biogenesis protein CcmH